MTLILVHPRLRFGRPYINGSGVKTETIYGRLLAGELKLDLCRDYGITLSDVLTAYEFERWCRRRGRYDAPYAERLIREHYRALSARDGALDRARALPGDWPRVVWPRKEER